MPSFVMTEVLPVDYGKNLNEARAAYHQFMMGGVAKVFVDQNGERVEYNSSNIGNLRAYIAELESLLGIARRVSGPMRVFMS